jgi:NDP-sugar pyrophosphorylase family protein
MTPPLSLVVLAAGLGSRYGGLKQFDPIGPGGTTLMDFSVHDARRSGFSRFVFVTRPELADQLGTHLKARYGSSLDLAVALQRQEDLPAGHPPVLTRTRPWGTSHAVWAARHEVRGGFAVLNADDFYGRAALESAADFLKGAIGHRFAVVGYRLDRTASEAGGVSRAVLERRPDGDLSHVTEVHDLVAASEGRFRGQVDGEPRIVAADALVSMNLWAFTPAIFPPIAEGFHRFLQQGQGDSAEYRLPDAIQSMIHTGRARVSVLPTDSHWAGVTYQADRPRVQAFLQQLVDSGAYPAQL